MTKQEQINMLQFRIERIESHLAEQHKGNNFNLSEKPNSCYDHLLPEGYQFCTEEEAEKWVKVEIKPNSDRQGTIGDIWEYEKHFSEVYKPYYRPIRKIQFHIAVHEAVTTEPNPYAVDWSNAPENADSHAFDKNGKGWFYGLNLNLNNEYWYAANIGYSGFTLPSNLDWTKSKTVRPCK